eukprot:SAG22_NODE_5668_length_975_cov_0.722603_3_plen_31_part_01
MPGAPGGRPQAAVGAGGGGRGWDGGTACTGT